MNIPQKDMDNALVMHDCGEYTYAVLKQAVGWGNGRGFLVVTKAGKGKRRRVTHCNTRSEADRLMRAFSEGV